MGIAVMLTNDNRKRYGQKQQNHDITTFHPDNKIFNCMTTRSYDVVEHHSLNQYCLSYMYTTDVLIGSPFNVY